MTATTSDAESLGVYACPIPDCNLHFSYRTDLARHVRDDHTYAGVE